MDPRGTRSRALAGSIVVASSLIALRCLAAPAELKIEDVVVQKTARPNDTICILWRVESTSASKSYVAWGTKKGHYTHTTATEHRPSGLRPYAVPIVTPDLPCTVFFVIHAQNAQGEHRESIEHSFVVENPKTPPGAHAAAVAPKKPIPDNDASGIEETISVAGTGSVLRVEVRVDVTHPRRGDLNVSLVSPAGTTVRLHTPSSDTSANLRGTYNDGVSTDLKSTDSLSVLEGEPFAGPWTLKVADVRAGEKGTLDAFAVTVFPVQPDGPPSANEARPELELVTPSQLSCGPDFNDPSKKALQYDTTFANIGEGPLEVRGQWDKKHQILNAYQRIYEKVLDSSGKVKGFKFLREKLVGEFATAYDGQLHFQDWAHAYLLDDRFRPAPGAKGVVKTTFMIEDEEPFKLSLPGAPKTMHYDFSGYLQGISVGWADTYGPGLTGQALDVTKTPQGTYYFVVEGTKLLDEVNSDKSNHNAVVKIALDPQHDSLTVLKNLTWQEFLALKNQPANISFKTDVLPVFQEHCTKCHNSTHPSAPFSLDPGPAYASLVGVPAIEAPLKRVEPGSVEKSYLWHKLEGTQASVGGSGTRMPPPGNPAPEGADLALIEWWIAAGAPNN